MKKELFNFLMEDSMKAKIVKELPECGMDTIAAFLRMLVFKYFKDKENKEAK